MKMQGMAESMKGMPQHMKQLEQAEGQKFDAMFPQMMTKHHAGAIQMAKTAQSQAEHQEVKDFATKLAPTQSEDRRQVEK